jgi:hypothetical protein
LEEIVPLLRCPATMGKLRIESEQALVAVPGSRRWPVKNGRPIFFGSAEEVREFPDSRLSNPMPAAAMKLIKEAQGPVLNMSAGGSESWFHNVVELETAIFRNTALLAMHMSCLSETVSLMQCWLSIPSSITGSRQGGERDPAGAKIRRAGLHSNSIPAAVA